MSPRRQPARSLRRLDAEELADLGGLLALRLDRGAEFRGRAGIDDLPGGGQPRDDGLVGQELAYVRRDALARLGRQVAWSERADQALDGQVGKARLAAVGISGAIAARSRAVNASILSFPASTSGRTMA